MPTSNVYTTRVRFRHRNNKTLWDCSPLRSTNFTFTVERNYSTFHNTSIIYTELLPDTVPLDSNCSILPQSVFIWWEIKQAIMPIKIFHTSDDVVVRKRSKHRTPPPYPMIRHNVTCSTSQCALTIQKYAQAVRFLIPDLMRKNF